MVSFPQQLNQKGLLYVVHRWSRAFASIFEISKRVCLFDLRTNRSKHWIN